MEEVKEKDQEEKKIKLGSQYDADASVASIKATLELTQV